MKQTISPRLVAESLTECWSPRVIAELDDSYIKVAKLIGSFTWHNHENEDELFFILRGSLRIELVDGEFVELKEGELFVTPKSVQHLPVAEEECLVMLVERKSAHHTRDQVSASTRSLQDQLRPV